MTLSRTIRLFPALCALVLLSSCSGQEQARAIRKLSELSELGTVEYTVKKIISADDDVWYKYGDRKILYSSVAYLKAGIDMSGFSEDDVVIDKLNNSISVTFPKARLLSFNMPLDRIRLEYSRITGLRSDFSTQERLALKQQGELAIREDVPNMGILEDAETNAREYFTAMFSRFGFSKIEVNFK